MPMKSIISSKGQVTIPAKVRRALRLEPGDRVEYRLADGKAELLPAKGTILDAAGSVKPRQGRVDTGAIRKAVKGEVGRRATRRDR